VRLSPPRFRTSDYAETDWLGSGKPRFTVLDRSMSRTEVFGTQPPASLPGSLGILMRYCVRHTQGEFGRIAVSGKRLTKLICLAAITSVALGRGTARSSGMHDSSSGRECRNRL
jgi:hypothetical protein